MDTDDTAFLAVVVIGVLFVLALLGYGSLAVLGVVGDDAGGNAGPSLAGDDTPTEADAPEVSETTVRGGETTEATDDGDDAGGDDG